MVAKRKHYHKPIPQYKSMFKNNYIKALYGLSKTCIKLQIKKLAMPRMGCNCDRLSWENFMKPNILKIFDTVPMEIMVCGSAPGILRHKNNPASNSPQTPCSKTGHMQPHALLQRVTLSAPSQLDRATANTLQGAERTTRETEARATNGSSPGRETALAASPWAVPLRTGELPRMLHKGELACLFLLYVYVHLSTWGSVGRVKSIQQRGT
jgi:hypothetical protein